MRKENATFDTKFISEPGSYLANHDYFAFVELKDYACYVVADGIDNDDRKESAKLAVTTIITAFSENPGMSKGKIRRYIKAAHNTLLSEAQEIRLEASVVILLTDYKKAVWAHSGNCRLYWIRNGSVRAITKDTSLTQRMADNEEISLDMIATHEERNNLYAYLGQPGRVNYVISGTKKLNDGDIFILTSRGVWENVGEPEIIDSVDGASKAEEVCTGLEDVILSQRLECIENYTIASVFVNKVYNNPKAGMYKKILRISLTVIVALSSIISALVMTHRNKINNLMFEMDNNKKEGIEYLVQYSYPSAKERFVEANDVVKSVKAKRGSKNYVKKEGINYYFKMSEQMVNGIDYLADENYNKAGKAFESASGYLNRLETEFGEDVSQYKPGIEAYKAFASEMNEGNRRLEEKDYNNAVKQYTAAFEEMKNIDEVGMQEKAKNACLVAEGGVYCEYGDRSVAEAKAAEQALDYDNAIICANNAISNYSAAAERNFPNASVMKENAEEMYNRLITVRSQLSIEKKIEIIRNKIEETEAITVKKDAIASYEGIIDELKALKESGPEEKYALMIDDMLEEVTVSADSLKQDTESDLMDAIKYLSRSRYDDAIQALERAKDKYKEAKNNSAVDKIKDYIDNIKDIKAASANQ